MTALEYRQFGRETWRDPYALYRRLRDEDPVHHSPEGYWVLSRFADVWDAACDTTVFSSSAGIGFQDNFDGVLGFPSIVSMDPPDHTRYRRLVSNGFIPRRVEEIEPALRSYVRERVEALRAEGSGDFCALLARPIPIWLVGHYLGVPDADRDEFETWVTALNGTSGAEAMLEATGRLNSYFADLVERRRSNRGFDLVSHLLDADDQGRGVGLDVILGFIFTMISGGNDTTPKALAGAADLLTQYPDQRRRLIDDPSAIPNALEEMLRLTSPVQGVCRLARHDAQIRGVPIPAGSRVLLAYAAANRDPREFGPTADDLDVMRHITRFLVLGAGSHFCLGAAAARLQGRVVLEELLRACPDFAVDTEAGVLADGGLVRGYESLPFVASAR